MSYLEQNPGDSEGNAVLPGLVCSSSNSELLDTAGNTDSGAVLPNSYTVSLQNTQYGEIGHSRNSSNTSQVSLDYLDVGNPLRRETYKWDLFISRCPRDLDTAVSPKVSTLDRVPIVIPDKRGKW